MKSINNVEILNIFKNIINNYSSNSIFDFEDYEITYVQVKSLLDYITKLQEEIKELKEDKSKMFETAIKRNNQLLDRIDKAIEFIEEELTFYITIGGTDERKLIGYNKAFDELLKILKGVDKE